MQEEIEKYDVDLEAYLNWLVDSYPPAALRSKIATAVVDYSKALTTEQRSFPQNLLNAGEIFFRLSNSKIASGRVMELLENMCEQHVLYFLFSSQGINIDRYTEAARKYIKKFPKACNTLPDKYKELVEVLKNDSIR